LAYLGSLHILTGAIPIPGSHPEIIFVGLEHCGDHILGRIFYLFLRSLGFQYHGVPCRKEALPTPLKLSPWLARRSFLEQSS